LSCQPISFFFASFSAEPNTRVPPSPSHSFNNQCWDWNSAPHFFQLDDSTICNYKHKLLFFPSFLTQKYLMWQIPFPWESAMPFIMNGKIPLKK
jgi:hypothetical protein